MCQNAKNMQDRMRGSDNVNLCQILYVKKIGGMPERMSKKTQTQMPDKTRKNIRARVRFERKFRIASGVNLGSQCA